MMLNDWNIKSRSHTCQATGTSFQEGDFFYTLLFSRKEGYERLDLSEAAWEERKQDPAAPVAFSLWRSLYELPPAPAPEPIPKNDAEGMLRHLLSLHDSKNRNAIYILAVMLERKKILKPLPSSEKPILVYEHHKTGETFLIEDPYLSLENLLEVQQEVSSFLNQSVVNPVKSNE
ncbi:MAG: hypothetical protein K9M81_02565 [Chthoniobacterales bacterium]|nr:hypothetical protein [Chthoniobacterales bacterium]